MVTSWVFPLAVRLRLKSLAIQPCNLTFFPQNAGFFQAGDWAGASLVPTQFTQGKAAGRVGFYIAQLVASFQRLTSPGAGLRFAKCA